MSANAQAPPGPEVWQAQNLQLIAFPREPQFAAPQNWWQGLTGSEPENTKRQRQLKEESGIHDGANISLGIDLLRIQWTVTPRMDADAIDASEQPPTLGQFMDRKDSFIRLMGRWLPNCPPIHRLAF